MNKFNVTLPALRKAGACVNGYNRLVRTLQGLEFTADDAVRTNWLRFVHKDPVSIRTILDSNGIDDALWALRCIDNADDDKDVRLFAIWCARQVDQLMTDARSTAALDVAERHAYGLATDDELDAAVAAARDAAWAANRVAAGAAARDAAWDAASDAAGAAAWAANRVAAWAAARDAAWAAAWAASWAAAGAAAWTAAWTANMDAQKNRLIEMLDAFEVIE